MHKLVKNDLCEIIEQLANVIESLLINGNIISQESAYEVLADCQQTAVEIGNKVEESEGEGEATIHMLEEYCEKLYLLCVNWNDAKVRERELKSVRKLLDDIRNSILYGIDNFKKEVVFLPYKAAMWDSLESVWKAAQSDSECNVYVIPIPYYDKNQDGSLGKMHYEGDLYPDYVTVTHYESYDFEKRRPDVIFIHNPYDGGNLMTSVHPFFYAKNLKKITEKLVYIPYFVFPGNFAEQFVLTAGVLFSDETYVQNDITREKYLNTLQNKGLQREYFENKIFAFGTPKTDKVYSEMVAPQKVPKEWEDKIANKKVIFFNTNVNLILNNAEYFADNMERIFRIFEEYSEKYAVIWREHPLSIQTLELMRPDLLFRYKQLIKEFEETTWGIIDRNVEAYTAMCISDCYFGAGGSLITLYSVTGKPMMVTDYKYPSGIKEEKITLDELIESGKNKTYYNEKNSNSLSIYLENMSLLEKQKEQRIAIINRCTYNIDGTVGHKIYENTKKGK